MNRHLSSQQMSEWALGERPPEVEQHLRGCPACHANVTRQAEALAQFRGSVRAWSEQQFGAVSPIRWEAGVAHSSMRWNSFRWVCLVVLVFVVVLLPMAWRGRHPAVTGLASADAAMLNQVDTEISRTVPRPMEPLMKLVSWDDRSATHKAVPEYNRE